MRPMPLVASVAQALRETGLPGPGGALVVGVSAGPDSTALLDALVTLSPRLGFRVVAAHLDHRLRPGSAADAAACEALCRRLGVPLRQAEADVRGRAARDKAGLEDAARRERYAFLRRVMREEGAQAVAVGHTSDDQAETVLLRLLRGAGATGLGAMRLRRGDLVRPLLRVSRSEVLAYLAARGLAFREDPSNADPAFVRNRVRHELLPSLERFNPRIRDTLARAAAVLADEADLVAEAGATLLARVARPDGPALLLDRAGLAAAHPAAARAALRLALDQTGGRAGVAAVHVERLLALARAARPSGRRLPLPGGREALVRFGELRLGPPEAPPVPYALPLAVPGEVSLPEGRALVCRPARGPARVGAERAVVAWPVEAPLFVRTRRPGDRVFVKGKAMSLKRFLLERRVPVDARGRLPLVASGPDVLFVPGLGLESRPGRRFVRLEVRG